MKILWDDEEEKREREKDYDNDDYDDVNDNRWIIPIHSNKRNYIWN